MKYGFTIKSQRVNARVWNETSSFASKEKVQMCPTARRLMLSDFGTHMGYYWNNIKRGVTQ
jgi:hypothetical protein